MAYTMDIRTAIANQNSWINGFAKAKKTLRDPDASLEEERKAWREMKDCLVSLVPYMGDVEYDLVRDEDGVAVRDGGAVITDYDRIVSCKMGFVQMACKAAQENRGDEDERQNFYEKRFETFNEMRCKEAYKRAVSYSMSPNTFFSEYGWVVITGETKSGKTHLAYGIANRLAEVGIPTMFGTLEQHLESIDEEIFGRRPETYLIKMLTTPMLVIDALGEMPLTNDAGMLLENVTKRRHDYRLPTVITTRMSLDELYGFVGRDIAERIHNRAAEINTRR